MAFSRAASLRRLTAEAAWVVAGQLAAAAGTLVGVRFLTGLLAPSEYGRLALGLTLAMLANQILFGPLVNGISRFYAAAVERGEVDAYSRACASLVVRAIGVMLAIVGVVSVAITLGGQETIIPIVLAATAFAVLGSCGAIAAGIHTAARRRSLVATHQAIDAWSRFMLAMGLMTTFGASATIALSGYSVAAAVVTASLLFFVAKRMPVGGRPASADDTCRWKADIARFSWPFSVFGIFTWLQIASDRWALELFAGTETVGHYEVLFQLGYAPIVLASSVVVQLFSPILFERAGDTSDPARNAEVRKSIVRLTALIAAGTVVAALIGFAFHDAIFALAAGIRYREVAYLLPWMILGAGIFSAAQVVSLYFMTELKTKLMVMPKIATALFGVAANALAAYAGGVVGVVIAGLVFSVLYFVWISAVAMRSIRAS